jgi:hypothetical protein
MGMVTMVMPGDECHQGEYNTSAQRRAPADLSPHLALLQIGMLLNGRRRRLNVKT